MLHCRDVTGVTTLSMVSCRAARLGRRVGAWAGRAARWWSCPAPPPRIPCSGEIGGVYHVLHILAFWLQENGIDWLWTRRYCPDHITEFSCPLQTLSHPPASQPMHAVVEEFALYQDVWASEFIAVLEKVNVLLAV